MTSSLYLVFNEQRWLDATSALAESQPLGQAQKLDSSGIRGADRDRTDDLRLAKPALSQLSYSPIWCRAQVCWAPRVGQGRLELPTSRLSGVRSNHLSYWPGQVTAFAAARPSDL